MNIYFKNTIFTIIFLFLSSNALSSDKSKISALEFFEKASELFNDNKKACIKQYQIFIKKYSNDKLVPEAEFLVGECSYNMDPLSEEASESFKKVPSEGAAFRAAEILYNRKNYSKAVDALEKVESSYPKGYLQHEVKLLKAQCYIILGRFKEAENLLLAVINKQPAYRDDKRFNYAFGLVNYQLGKNDIALVNLEKNDSPQSFLFSSKALIRMEKPLHSIEKLKELINKYPESSLQEYALYLIGEAFLVAKDYDSAIKSYERFIRLYPRSSLRGTAIFKIGCSYLELNDYLQARANFQSFLQLEPKAEFAPLSVYLIGESFLREKRFKEASFAFADMASAHPGNFYAPNAQFRLGWCFYNMENFAQARDSLMLFKQLFPDHNLISQVEILLGNTFCELEQYDQGTSAYQRVIDRTQSPELRESAFALMSRSNYLNHNYAALVSGYHYLLKAFPPNKSPWRLLSYLYLAEGYLKQGLYKEAGEIYNSIESIYPASPYLIYAKDGLAWTDFLNGDYTKAQAQRENIIALSRQKELPKDLLSVNQYEIANTFFNQKKYLEALEAYNLFLNQNSGHNLTPSAVFRVGYTYYKLEYFSQAIETWESLEKSFPASPQTADALWKTADTYFRAQYYDKAVEVYKRILERYAKNDKEEADAHLRIAQCYYNSKNNTPAFKALKGIIEKYPNEPKAYDALDFLVALIEVSESKETILSELQNDIAAMGRKPIMVELRFRLARSFFENKKYDETVQLLDEVISELIESDKFADANYYLAVSYYKLSRFKEAIPVYKRFIENFPEDKRIENALFYLGSAQFKEKQFADAAVTFEKLANEHPDSEYIATALYNTAIAYREIKEWDKAAAVMQVYQKKYNDKEEAFDISMQLASIYEEQNQYQRAIEVITLGLDKLDKNSETWGELEFRIAEDYIAMGNTQEAVNTYKKLISEKGNHADPFALNAMVRLAEHYERSNDIKEALSLYQRVYEKSASMADRPSWLDAVKTRIEMLRTEINKQVR
ncbi:MAG: tetratricopeptide repeat protein [Elusimicrobia bacterium]|nr:tetratricopeptide repeat protein [Candidatus Liberimonas magnetica]